MEHLDSVLLLKDACYYPMRFCCVSSVHTQWGSLVFSSDSMLSCVLVQRLVVKPDQLIKRRGKLGLVGINLDLQGVQDWVRSRLMKETMVSSNHTSALFYFYFFLTFIFPDKTLRTVSYLQYWSGPRGPTRNKRYKQQKHKHDQSRQIQNGYTNTQPIYRKCFSSLFPMTLSGKHRTACLKLVWLRYIKGTHELQFLEVSPNTLKKACFKSTF